MNHSENTHNSLPASLPPIFSLFKRLSLFSPPFLATPRPPYFLDATEDQLLASVRTLFRFTPSHSLLFLLMSP